MRYVTCLLLAVSLSACASRGPHVWPAAAAAQQAPSPPVPAASSDSLATFIAKVRELAAEARPERPQLQTVEATDPALRDALAAAATPSPGAYRAVSREYRRLGIFDRAHQYLRRALQLQPADAATYDALARLWRDSGFPALALGDAYRAVFHAPESAVTHNTLGTVLQALGRRALARAEYERALHLDPGAAYALNNLCYGWVLEGSAVMARQACERALTIDPDFAAARNNLGLALVVGGDLEGAQRAFGAGGDPAVQLYNSGIVFLAQRRFDRAVQAFQAAYAARPTMTIALARAKQASMAASNINEVKEP